jgi:hypothetical protein
MRFPLLFDRYSAADVPDAQGYLLIAQDVVDGRGFDRIAGGLLRTPGYPLFIALMDQFPGRREDAVIVVQHLLGVGLCVAVLLLAWRWFGKRPAIVAAALVAIGPQLITVEHDVLTDFLFGVLVFAGASALAECVWRQRAPLGLLVAAGLLFGAATEVRPTGQVLVLAAPVVLALTTRSLRATIRGSLVVTVTMALVVGPYIVRNEVRHGAPVLSIVGMEALFQRVFDQDHLPVVTSGPDADVAKRIYARTRPADGITTHVFDVYVALVKRGHTDYEAARIEAGMALDAIRAEPVAYARGTARNLRTLWQWGDIQGAATGVTLISSDRAHAGATSPRAIRWTFGSIAAIAWPVATVLGGLWWILSLATLSSLLVMRVRTRAGGALFAFAWVWFLVVGITAAAAVPTFRFSGQALPLLWVVGSVGFVFVIDALRSALRRGGGTPRVDEGRTSS